MPLIDEIQKIATPSVNRYPFSLPLFINFTSLHLSQNVTILVGGNGSGKSTLLELIAIKLNLPRISLQSGYDEAEFLELKQCELYFRLNYLTRPRGFFFRSEDFITYLHYLATEKVNALNEIANIDEEYQSKSSYSRSMAKMPHYRTLAEMEQMYQQDLAKQSHGESFLDFFQSRMKNDQLYLLDEAEMPLSPSNQMTLLVMIQEAVERGCQFIISTHSPILMSFPGATIYELKEECIYQIDYDEIESVVTLKDFLNHKERYLKHLFNKTE